MSKRFLWILIQPVFAAGVAAQNWQMCAMSMDDVRRASRDATHAAEDVDSKHQDLEDCLLFPGMYDLFEDGCQSYRHNVDSGVRTLDYEVQALLARLTTALEECGYE